MHRLSRIRDFQSCPFSLFFFAAFFVSLSQPANNPNIRKRSQNTITTTKMASRKRKAPTHKPSPLEDIRRMRKERTLGLQMKELINYLRIHDRDLLGEAHRIVKSYAAPGNRMRKDLRELIGEMHWRRYLEYYSHFDKTGKRIKIELTSAHIKTAPPFPTLSKSLNADVTSTIFSFLDGKDMYEASKVSRQFRDALIPRQRNITFEGFRTVASFRQMNFLGAVYFSGGQREALTDYTLPLLIGDSSSLPNLARVNTAYCRNVSSFHCEKAMGPRLEKFIS